MDFVDFLKKYSTINNEFINDFNAIINSNYMDRLNEFLIDSDVLQKWLGINQRENMISTLKTSYKKNIDYITKKTSKKGHGGHNKIIYVLTQSCAKKICMASKSQMSKQIRDYFIEIEGLLYKYKDYIIENLNEKIAKVERNQKPKMTPRKGIIYVFRALNTNATLYKLGKTIDSKKRFNSHNSPLANDIEVVFVYESDNIEQVELCTKMFMKKAKYRKYKEIYKIDISILKKVIKKCDIDTKQINNKIVMVGGNVVSSKDILYMLIPAK